MEISCPDCSQRLRVPDGLANPLLRCRNCGSTFRQNAAVAVPDATIAREQGRWVPPEPTPIAKVSPIETPFEETVPVAVEVEKSPSRPRNDAGGTKSFGKGILVVLIFILIKGGLRLTHQLFREKPKPPEPVQLEDPRLIRERILQRLEEERLKQQRLLEEQAEQLEPIPPLELPEQ